MAWSNTTGVRIGKMMAAQILGVAGGHALFGCMQLPYPLKWMDLGIYPLVSILWITVKILIRGKST